MTSPPLCIAWPHVLDYALRYALRITHYALRSAARLASDPCIESSEKPGLLTSCLPAKIQFDGSHVTTSLLESPAHVNHQKGLAFPIIIQLLILSLLSPLIPVVGALWSGGAGAIIYLT